VISGLPVAVKTWLTAALSRPFAAVLHQLFTALHPWPRDLLDEAWHDRRKKDADLDPTRSSPVRRLISFVKKIARWARRGCVLFSGPLVAFGVPLIAWAIFRSELGLRAGGFALQVLGVWIVWVGIRGTRERFEVPSTWEQAKTWVASFPSWRGKVVQISGVAVGATAGGSARGYAWHGPGPDPSLEQRLDALEKNLRGVRKDLSAHQVETDKQAREQAEAMKREREEREAAAREIHEKIRATQTDGLTLIKAGVWWLLFGTICATFPQEIADAATRIGGQ
jgi:hypothetical protein